MRGRCRNELGAQLARGPIGVPPLPCVCCLAGNGIGAEGAKAIGLALQTNTSLTSLDLSGKSRPLYALWQLCMRCQGVLGGVEGGAGGGHAWQRTAAGRAAGWRAACLRGSLCCLVLSLLLVLRPWALRLVWLCGRVLEE